MGFHLPHPQYAPWIRVFTHLNPLRHLLVIICGIFLERVGLETLWPQRAALALLAFAGLTLSAARFQKTIL